MPDARGARGHGAGSASHARLQAKGCGLGGWARGVEPVGRDACTVVMLAVTREAGIGDDSDDVLRVALVNVKRLLVVGAEHHL